MANQFVGSLGPGKYSKVAQSDVVSAAFQYAPQQHSLLSGSAAPGVEQAGSFQMTNQLDRRPSG